MERLTKKATILLSPELHARLADLARSENTSIGDLIRRAANCACSCLRQRG